MSKSRHASKPSRKRSVWVAAILLVVLGLVSAGFWFVSSQSNPQPAPTPTISTPATPTPTVTPTPTPTPTPTINENELSVRVWAKGTDNQNNYLWVVGWVNGSDETTRFKVDASLFDSIQSSQTYIFTVTDDEPDGVPLITAVR